MSVVGAPKVCLVNMPFSAIMRPSIGLSLLQSALRGAGIDTRVLYANLCFAESVGAGVHELICELGPEKLLGEWVFAGAASPELEADPDNIQALARAADPQGRAASSLAQLMPGVSLADLLIELRRMAPNFIDWTARVVLATEPQIVGCTSLYQQHTAALALLRRIRQLAPQVVTMIGGANCEGPMGQVVARRFPWVDVVVSGEADELIVPLVQELSKNGRHFDPKALPTGVITADHGSRGPAPRAKVREMDRLPIPDYDDYFLAVQASPIGQWIEPALLMETSRGCWWGEVAHCTFCGLNGSGMGYRSKSPERALFELDALAGRYGSRRFEMVDNILDMGYLKNVLPTLAERGAPYGLFYETKANLKREQVEQLVRGGVYAIQPGIESLHDEALERVDKGCSVMHNVQLLKWSRQFGLKLMWNLLTGLPGEEDRWWSETAGWLHKVEHLEPPSGVTPIHFQRYSPYHFRAADFGLALAPSGVYRHLFALPEEELAELAYYFEDRAGAVPAKGEGRRQLEAAVDRWRQAWATPLRTTPFGLQDARPRLEWRRTEDGDVHVFDSRRCATAAGHRLTGAAASIHLALESATGRGALLRRLEKRGFERSELEDALATLDRHQLLLEQRGKLIALAVDANPAAPRGVDPRGVDPRAKSSTGQSVAAESPLT